MQTTVPRRIHQGGPPPTSTIDERVLELLRHIANGIAGLKSQQHDFFSVYLDARFPYGDGQGDRFSRPRRRRY
jgi:hypothetical protein